EFSYSVHVQLQALDGLRVLSLREHLQRRSDYCVARRSADLHRGCRRRANVTYCWRGHGNSHGSAEKHAQRITPFPEQGVRSWVEGHVGIQLVCARLELFDSINVQLHEADKSIDHFALHSHA